MPREVKGQRSGSRTYRNYRSCVAFSSSLVLVTMSFYRYFKPEISLPTVEDTGLSARTIEEANKAVKKYYSHLPPPRHSLLAKVIGVEIQIYCTYQIQF